MDADPATNDRFGDAAFKFAVDGLDESATGLLSLLF